MTRASLSILTVLATACSSAKPAPQQPQQQQGAGSAAGEENERPATCPSAQGEDAQAFATLTANQWCASTATEKGTVKARLTLEADGHMSMQTDLDKDGNVQRISKLHVCWQHVPTGLAITEGGKTEVLPATLVDGKIKVGDAAFYAPCSP